MTAYTVGVDVGGTKVAAVLVDEAGDVVRRCRKETESGTYTGLLAGIVSAATEVREGLEVAGVGLAIAGNVAADGSHVLFSPHLPLAGEPLARDLRDGLRTPVQVENDANAAAWCEHEAGAGRGTTEMLMVALGTGLGAGLVLRNQVYRGHQGFAGEAGHITMVIDGRACPCGGRGCWERYASGTALVAHYVERGGDPEVGGPGITKAAAAGEPLAVAALADVGEWLGRGLASLVAVLDPEVIVVGGGVSEAGDLLLDPARRQFAASVTGADVRPLPRIVPALMGNDAGVIGAAMLVRGHAG